MSATHPRLKKSIQEKAVMNQQLQEYIKKEKDKPLRSLEDWGEELKSQSKDIVIYEETKQETQLQEYKPLPREETEPTLGEIYQKSPYLQIEHLQTEQYIRSEPITDKKIIIARTIHYDYFEVPIDWDSKDIKIHYRELYYKQMKVECKAKYAPRDINYPRELYIDYKVQDYTHYFQQPTM